MALLADDDMSNVEDRRGTVPGTQTRMIVEGVDPALPAAIVRARLDAAWRGLAAIPQGAQKEPIRWDSATEGTFALPPEQGTPQPIGNTGAPAGPLAGALGLVNPVLYRGVVRLEPGRVVVEADLPAGGGEDEAALRAALAGVLSLPFLRVAQPVSGLPLEALKASLGLALARAGCTTSYYAPDAASVTLPLPSGPIYGTLLIEPGEVAVYIDGAPDGSAPRLRRLVKGALQEATRPGAVDRARLQRDQQLLQQAAAGG